MAAIRNEIPPEDFYGGRSATQDKIDAILRKQQLDEKPPTPRFMTRLLGPSTTWEVFKKQQDAIDSCLHRRNGLMCFAFEDIHSRRMFLVAHPKVFWSFNCNRFFKNCSTYEIIQEYSTCKLYLDIEFEYAYNSGKNGNKMLSNMLTILNVNLHDCFGIDCFESDILDLDSSSDVKYSHHVIYEIKNTAFQDNYAVGSFIRKICTELKEAFEKNISGDNSKLKEVADKYGLEGNDILELFVYDRKNTLKLFIDEGVYTKNRHFRTLGSSKLTKNIPLVISKTNKYKPQSTSDSYDCCLFLDSLITYFSWKVERVLEFEDLSRSKKGKTINHPNPGKGEADQLLESSLHPQMDSFINRLISPQGRIRRKVYFSNTSTIVYDIQGFRYCDHVKREHKSNNIKYIIDLQSLTYYQKCYDPDCENFRSDVKRLPEEICFLFEDDTFLNDSTKLDFSEIPSEYFTQALKQIETTNFDNSISDEDLEKVFDCTEAMLDVNW